MNEAIAKIHFPESTEDPESLYAEKLFRIKQFYFQHTPIPKVKQQKIKELIDLHDAFLTRFPQIEIRSNISCCSIETLTSDFKADFSIIENQRAQFKRLISSTHNALDLAHFLEKWYEFEFNFALLYSSIYVNSDLSTVNLSQNIDPMLIHESFMDVEQNLIVSPENHIFWTNIPNPIRQELMRCSKFIHLHDGII